MSAFQYILLLEGVQLVPRYLFYRLYDIFGFELLQILQLSISKPLKECTFKYLGSDGEMTHPGN